MSLLHLYFSLCSETVFELIAVCYCDIIALFVFCISGEIIIHSHDISNDVYQLNWYEFDTKSIFAVFLMIARTQEPYRFTLYESINCSLETFVIV